MATIRCQDQSFTDIEAVIFDKDGTLADVASFLKSLAQKRSRLTDAQVPGVQEPLLLAFGVEEGQLNPAGLQAVGSRRENEIAAAAYIAETGKNWNAALDIAQSAFAEADSYLKRKADHTPLFPGTREVLQALTAAKVKIGILSADIPKNIGDFIDCYELTCIDAYQGVEGTISKPDPQLYEQLCTQLKVAPERTLMIGDAQVDMIMAQSAEAAGCIQVTWGWPNAKSYPEAHAVIDQWQHFQLVA
ncbi:HAD family hydrolase [Acaryochloris thomasi]|uniref:HAD family hydrolase n=1 Tax=Acaryochloris thomasi TaxID=2929456 RepID=UPI000DA6492C|nr:HAD family hydrolase [Acaryochloris thomasi]